LLKARKAVEATRHLGERFGAWQSGAISFAEFDASVQGWINHVRYADTWGLRGDARAREILAPGCAQRTSVPGRGDEDAGRKAALL
jgi:hypothetical protein